MSHFSYRHATPCLECPNPCCQYVKRMPYMGEPYEVLYRTLLLGAFPLWMPDLEIASSKHFWAMEWIVPAEMDSCPAYSESRLCSIYNERPVSCRNFPVIGPGGKLHDFCPNPRAFLKNHFEIPDFLKRVDRIRTFVRERLYNDGEVGIRHLVLEEDPVRMPLLYNGLWLLFLLVSEKINIYTAIDSQRILLEKIKSKGHQELTILIPHSDYCVTGEIDRLICNLDYLKARCEQENLLKKGQQVVSMLV